MKKTNATTDTNSSSGIQRSKLEKLFEEELKDMYWAEKALTKAIPKMIKKSTSEELSKALQDHLAQTEGHVSRIEEVFRILEKEPEEKKCEAMNGLIKEAEEIIKESEDGAMRDAGIISAAQKVEHYEIASYGTLRTFASTLGIQDAASILQLTLDEEKAADDKLSEIAESEINIEASEEQDSE
jgi:ferritin-like metal-binding protein YciE